MHIAIAALLAGLAGTFVPAAQAQVLEAGGTDAAGEAPLNGEPYAAARDARALVVRADETRGAYTATAELAAAPGPTETAQLSILVGRKNASAGSCSVPGVQLIAPLAGGDGAWTASDDGLTDVASGAATVTRDGPRITISASAALFQGRGENCAAMSVRRSDAPSSRYDILNPFDLVVVEPAPTPTPPPTPPPPPPAPPGPPPGTGPKAALAVELVAAPRSKLRRGRKLGFKAKVTNVGSAPASDVRLRVAGTRGLRAPKALKLGTLAPGGSSTRTLQVKLGARARATTKTSLLATGAAKLRADRPVVLRVGKRLRPADTGAAPIGRIFWRFEEAETGNTAGLTGYAIVNDRWAYRGIPEEGMPECSQRTAEGEDGDGCVPFSHDPRTGAVTIDGRRGEFKGTELTLGQETFTILATAAAGTRLDVELTHAYASDCGYRYAGTCRSGFSHLRLLPDGQFSFASERITSNPFVTVSGEDDERGVYEFLPGHRLRLTFANGTVEIRTVGIRVDKAGRPDPAGTGLVLGAAEYEP